MKDLYEKDYTSLKHKQEEAPAEMNTDLVESSGPSLMDIYEFYWKVTSKHIISKGQANYDYLLKRCDGLAQIYNGKICGLVDHQNYTAQIKLTLPNCINFANNDDLLLREIAEKASSVSFGATEEGNLLMSIDIKYFIEAESFGDFFSRRISALTEQRELFSDEKDADIGFEELLTILGKSLRRVK